MKFYKSISFKFSSWYLAILGTLLIVLGCGVYFSLSKRLYNNLDNTLRARAEQVVRFRNVMGLLPKEHLKRSLERFSPFTIIAMIMR